MLYKDHADLADAYDKVLIKENVLSSGITSNEPANPSPSPAPTQPTSALDTFKGILQTLNSYKGKTIDENLYHELVNLFQKATMDYYREGQKHGKDIYK